MLPRFTLMMLGLLIFPFTDWASGQLGDLQVLDLDHWSDHQVIVDKEAGQYLGHPTTCLLDDGKTILCVKFRQRRPLARTEPALIAGNFKSESLKRRGI